MLCPSKYTHMEPLYDPYTAHMEPIFDPYRAHMGPMWIPWKMSLGKFETIRWIAAALPLIQSKYH